MVEAVPAVTVLDYPSYPLLNYTFIRRRASWRVGDIARTGSAWLDPESRRPPQPPSDHWCLFGWWRRIEYVFALRQRPISNEYDHNRNGSA